MVVVIAVPYLLIVVGLGYVRQGAAIGLILTALAIKLTLSVCVLSSLVCTAATIGLWVGRGNPVAIGKFRRMLLVFLPIAVVSGLAFWWVSKGATVPVVRH